MVGVNERGVDLSDSRRLLHVDSVRKTYGPTVALDGVSLAIPSGEVVGIVGPNGAGKSTLVSLIAGLIRPDAGNITVSGVDVATDPGSVRKILGFVPQDVSLYLQRTALGNLTFFGQLAGLRRQDIAAAIEWIAPPLGLEEFLDRPVHSLSGGQKRRLHAGVALLNRPRLLLLDEPTAGVDVETRNKILELVKRLANDGMTICYTTHYLEELEALNARVVIIARGKIILEGVVSDLLAAYGNTSIELEFRTEPPRLTLDRRSSMEYDGSTVRIFTDRPEQALVEVIQAVGTSALTAIRMGTANLEAIYTNAMTARGETHRQDNPWTA